MKRLLLMLSAGVLLVGCSSEEEAPEAIRPVLSGAGRYWLNLMAD